jgi:nitrite reductase/ring-hydroxylating ferredoxin subunit
MSQSSLPAADVPRGRVAAIDDFAVGNNGDYFAVSRRCRHLGADLAEGSIDVDGCLVCPWHQAKYDVDTGLMTRGPQGIFAKIPGLGSAFMILTRIRPLSRRKVQRRNDRLYLAE